MQTISSKASSSTLWVSQIMRGVVLNRNRVNGSLTTYSESPSSVTSCETSGMTTLPFASVPSEALPDHLSSILTS